MTLLQFLTSKEFGCCTTGELMQYNKADKEGYLKLREWAIEEMKNRQIPNDTPAEPPKTN